MMWNSFTFRKFSYRVTNFRTISKLISAPLMVISYERHLSSLWYFCKVASLMQMARIEVVNLITLRMFSCRYFEPKYWEKMLQYCRQLLCRLSIFFLASELLKNPFRWLVFFLFRFALTTEQAVWLFGGQFFSGERYAKCLLPYLIS